MIEHLSRVQKTDIEGFPKAGELIEITGAHELEAAVGFRRRLQWQLSYFNALQRCSEHTAYQKISSLAGHFTKRPLHCRVSDQKTSAVSRPEWSSQHAKSPVQHGFSVDKDIHCKRFLVTAAAVF